MTPNLNQIFRQSYTASEIIACFADVYPFKSYNPEGEAAPHMVARLTKLTAEVQNYVQSADYNDFEYLEMAKSSLTMVSTYIKNLYGGQAECSCYPLFNTVIRLVLSKLYIFDDELKHILIETLAPILEDNQHVIDISDILSSVIASNEAEPIRTILNCLFIEGGMDPGFIVNFNQYLFVDDDIKTVLFENMASIFIERELLMGVDIMKADYITETLINISNMYSVCANKTIKQQVIFLSIYELLNEYLIQPELEEAGMSIYKNGLNAVFKLMHPIATAIVGDDLDKILNISHELNIHLNADYWKSLLLPNIKALEFDGLLL